MEDIYAAIKVHFVGESEQSTGNTTTPLSPPPPPPPPVPPPLPQRADDSTLLLFIDRTNINSSDSRITLRIQQPTRGPWVVTPSKPWEAWSIAGFSSVVAGNGSRPHRLYYSCYEALRSPPRVCLAESHDGITWVKPPLGLFERNGSRMNNILLGAEGCSVFIDSRPDESQDARWKMVCSNGENKNIYNYASADGLRWRGLSAKPLTFSDDTEPTALFDNVLGQVRVQIIRHARTKSVGKYQSCMF